MKNRDFEYDICAVHGGLARFCEECGYLTVWRQSQEVMPARLRRKVREVKEAKEVKKARDVQEVKEELVSLADAMEGTERWARVRAKVNFFACVVSQEFGEDVVTCLDMSKGGVSFRTKKEYAKGVGVTIAVPYAPEVKRRRRFL